jgi:uncharacterized membrane protein
MTAHPRREKILHRLFQVGILFKGLDGLAETLGGVVFLCFSKGALTHFIFLLTRPELLEDPDDWIANSLRHAFGHLSVGSKLFVGAYLVGHGVIKLFLVGGLWRDKLWVFPIALLVLVAFIGFQVFRMATHFSLGLVLLTILDAIIVGLVWHEYRSKRGK